MHPFGICIAAFAMSALNHMPTNNNPSAITNFFGHAYQSCNHFVVWHNSDHIRRVFRFPLRWFVWTDDMVCLGHAKLFFIKVRSSCVLSSTDRQNYDVPDDTFGNGPYVLTDFLFVEADVSSKARAT